MIRGVEVDPDFEAKQRSFDTMLANGGGAASGMGDLTREQMRRMRIAERKRFVGMVGALFLILFGMTWVLVDVISAGKLAG